MNPNQLTSDQLFVKIFGPDQPISPRHSATSFHEEVMKKVKENRKTPHPQVASPWSIIKLAHRVNWKFHNGFNEKEFAARFNMHSYDDMLQRRMQAA